MSGSHNFEPKLISSLTGITITDIACGEHHSLALDTNGDVYSWVLQMRNTTKDSLDTVIVIPKKYQKELKLSRTAELLK